MIKRVETAVDSKDSGNAQKAFKEVMPELMKGITRGIFHKNSVSRKISRLNARVKAISV